MNILGLSCYYHDSAACLVRDGQIVAAASEERFSRRKHDPEFPAQATAYVLREAGLTPADLDAVAFYDGSGDFDNLDPVLTFLTLSPQTIDDVTAFMEALTDPRVAAETFPFDRPTLWSERAQPNPAPTGTGAVVGHSLVALGVTATSPAGAGNEGFRIGLTNGPPGELTTFATRFTSGPVVGSLRPFVPLFRNILVIDADGMATWVAPSVTDPALRGIAFDGQWVVRDATAPGGAARSELVSVTIE